VGCPHKECQEEGCEKAKSDDGFDMVEGQHRYEAAKEVGLFCIPSMIREMTDRQVLIFQLKCNAIRPKTALFEYARRLKILMKEGHTAASLSKLIDKTPRWVQTQLYLNRLCEEARGPVENGDITMGSALALANLPADLQPKFINDAIRMNQVEFLERAKAANRDFKAYLLQLQQEDREVGAVTPKLRAINVLKREAVKPKQAKEVIEAAGATTALQGWSACMAWMFKLDPISVERRKTNRKEKEKGTANQAEYHHLNRTMIKKFVHQQSSSGDYRNVE
jgi:ParB-like chromosome segregation protein Spo0J